MPDDDRSDPVNAAKPSSVRSDEVASSDPAPRPEPIRRTSAVLLRLTLFLAGPWKIVRLGSARLSDAARRFAAFRAGERALRRAVRLGTPLAHRLAVGTRSLAARAGLRAPTGVRRPARLVAVASVLCCLGLMAVVDAAGRPDSPPGASTASPDDPAGLSQPDQPAGDDSPDRPSRSAKRDRSGAGGSGSDEPAGSPPLADSVPVAGLSEVQMDNARAIVRTGRDMGMPRRALVIGVATAMQESNLLNRASEVLPESKRYPHQGTGWDHDSVGLFQQRTSSGWGPVNRLMDPAYATAQFFDALRRVSGWERMRLTEAAQAVQVSAYPEHYAKHEGEAAEVVEALVPRWR